MEEKQKNGGLVAAIIVLVIFIICILGYIGYDKLIAKTGSTEQQTEIEVKELKESDVKVLMDRIEVMDNHLAKLYPITDMTTISNQDLLSLEMRSGVSAEQIERTVRFVIGDNVTVKHEDYMCKDASHGALYKYSNGWYSYNNEHPGHGGASACIATAFFKSATLKGITITVDTNLLYEGVGDISGPRTSYYDSCPSNSNAKEALHDIERESLKAEYVKIKDTLPITTFTFKQNEAGIYNLESVTVK